MVSFDSAAVYTDARLQSIAATRLGVASAGSVNLMVGPRDRGRGRRTRPGRRDLPDVVPIFWTNVEQSIRDLTALATLFQMIVFSVADGRLAQALGAVG